MEQLGKIIFGAILGLLALFAAACSKEPLVSDVPADWSGSGETATLTFTIRTPAMSSTRAYPAGFENEIDDAAVFLAHDGGAGFVMDDMMLVGSGQFRTVSATTRAFTVNVPVSDVPTKVFVVANLMDVAGGLAASYGAGFTAANGKGLSEDAFVRTLADDWTAQCMYMAGSVVIPQITTGESNYQISLLRWLARADVRVDLAADSRTFVPTGVTLWHGYRKASVVASDADSPTIPSDESKRSSDSFVDISLAGTDGLVATAYLGEHDPATTYNDRLAAPCLIVGGYFEGSAAESFYRIDFNSGLAGHPFGQVLRNWQYVFNVIKILSAGYATAAEAAANPAHSIVVDVEMWDENVQQINFVDSGDYMYVSTLDVPFNYNIGAQGGFVVRSTISFDWGFDGSGTTVDAASTALLSNGKFSVSITARAVGATYTDYTFTATTLADNTSNVRGESVLAISARGVTMSVLLSQKAQRITERTINVLSLTDGVGSMGRYYKDGTEGGGNAMRDILTDTRWFGPTGVVKCGGFTFDRFQTGAMISTSPVSLLELQRALDATDILVTCYADDPPQEVVDLILKWNQKPYHVLFVASDANATLRTSLRESEFFNSGLSWYGIGDLGATFDPTTAIANNSVLGTELGIDRLATLYSKGGGALQPYEPLNVAANSFAVADQTTENITFTAGLFVPDHGMVSTTSSYKLWDDDALWAVPATDSPVMPLLVLRANLFGWDASRPVVVKTDAMLVGVDKAHTTVYIGDIEQFEGYLNTVPPTGSTAGLVGSPYYNSISALMSNIWAWAVGNVLAQVKED